MVQDVSAGTVKIQKLNLEGDEIDLEETLHDPEDMVAMSVI